MQGPLTGGPQESVLPLHLPEDVCAFLGLRFSSGGYGTSSVTKAKSTPLVDIFTAIIVHTILGIADVNVNEFRPTRQLNL